MIAYNKNVDIEFSAHGAFLDSPALEYFIMFI